MEGKYGVRHQELGFCQGSQTKWSNFYNHHIKDCTLCILVHLCIAAAAAVETEGGGSGSPIDYCLGSDFNSWFVRLSPPPAAGLHPPPVLAGWVTS